jgi:hypothetical protein
MVLFTLEMTQLLSRLLTHEQEGHVRALSTSEWWVHLI